MKRTLSSSRTFNNINNSGGISPAEQAAIQTNSNNIVLIDNELNDLSNNTQGLTVTVMDLSLNYYLYKTSNNAALTATNAAVTSNTSAVGTLTSGLSAAVSSISQNSGNINTVTASALANTNAITALTSSVVSNTSNINSNQNNIATNSAGLVVANQDILAIENAAVILQNRVNQNETTLLGKQETLSNTSNVTLRTLNFPDAISANTGNLLLPGNTQLFSGNAPGGVQAKIQNGNLYNFVSLDTTLLKNVTLGASWKYQNAASYAVNNATTGGILERIDPTSGQHNWYAAGNINKVMAWQPQNDQLFLSGNVLADSYLHRISGTNVFSYGFYQFLGASGSINMNTVSGIDIPWTSLHADGTSFTQGVIGSTQITVVAAGFYELNFNILLTSTVSRPNPTLRLRVNGTDTPYLSWSYIRSSGNHNESSWSMSPILIQLAAGDIISIQGKFTSNGVTGGVYLYNKISGTDPATPYLLIKRVA